MCSSDLAVGHDTTILHSTDSGLTWEIQFQDPEREMPLLDVLFINESEGFAIGAYGTYLTTFDGGKNWEDELISDSLYIKDANEDFKIEPITKEAEPKKEVPKAVEKKVEIIEEIIETKGVEDPIVYEAQVQCVMRHKRIDGFVYNSFEQLPFYVEVDHFKLFQSQSSCKKRCKCVLTI